MRAPNAHKVAHRPGGHNSRAPRRTGRGGGHFLRWHPDILGALSMKSVSRHASGASNFDVGCTFLGDFHARSVDSASTWFAHYLKMFGLLLLLKA